MVVLGIDFGTNNLVFAGCKDGGVHIIVNDLTKRSTPSYVSFTEKERFIGEGGYSQLISNYQNTVSMVKRLIGKDFSDIKNEVNLFPCKVVCGNNNSILVEVNYLGKVERFSPIQILAMLFQTIAHYAKKDTKSTSVAAVVGIPCYFNDRQRREVIQACTIAGVTCLRVVNDITAASFVYGLYKEVPKEGSINIAFVNAGHADTTCAIIRFATGKIDVLATSFDNNLGARNFEYALVDYILGKIEEKFKGANLLNDKKRMLRIQRECEKLKENLSANAKSFFRAECLVGEQDVSIPILREEFEVLSAKTTEKFNGPLAQLMKNSGLKLNQIDYVELLGGASYIPCVRAEIEKFFGKKPRTSCNPLESIALGCAFLGAKISTSFYLARDYTISESVSTPIELGWESLKEGKNEIKTTTMFKSEDFTPISKSLTFPRRSDFKIFASYKDLSLSPAGTRKLIGEYLIKGVKDSPHFEMFKLKLVMI